MEASRNIADSNTVSTAVILESSIPFRARNPTPPRTSAGISRTPIRFQRGCTAVDIRNTMKRKQRNASIAIVSGNLAYLFFINFYVP